MTILSKSNIQKTVKIPVKYSASDRAAIGELIIQRIKKRTRSGVDVNGRPFKYAKDSIYKGNNLEDSGDMFMELELISHHTGELLIGYGDTTSIEANQAEGMQICKPNPSLKKPFIGVTEEELDLVLAGYKPEVSEEKIQKDIIKETFFQKLFAQQGILDEDGED